MSLYNVSSPIRELFKNKILWQWTNKGTEFLNQIKNITSELSLLNIFDFNKQIVLQCESSIVLSIVLFIQWYKYLHFRTNLLGVSNIRSFI